jgi:LPS-assembly lipoprotein
MLGWVMMMLLTLGLVGGGCGFQPLYQAPDAIVFPNGAGGGGDTLPQTLFWLGPIDGRLGQMLYNRLTPRLYPHGWGAGAQVQARYGVAITLTEKLRDLDLRKNDTASRSQLIHHAVLTVADRHSRQVLFTTRLRAVNSYNILDSQFTTIVTEEDARKRGIEQLSDQIVQKLILWARTAPPSPPPLPDREQQP